MAIIVVRLWGKGSPLFTVGRYVNGAATVKISVEVSKENAEPGIL